MKQYENNDYTDLEGHKLYQVSHFRAFANVNNLE